MLANILFEQSDSVVPIWAASGKAYAFGLDSGHLGVANVDGNTAWTSMPFYHEPTSVRVPIGKYVVKAVTSSSSNVFYFEPETLSVLIFSDGTIQFYGRCYYQCNNTNPYATYNAGSPYQMPGQSIVDVGVSDTNTLICTASGRLFAMGDSYQGQFFQPQVLDLWREIFLGGPCKQVYAVAQSSIVLLRTF